MKTSLLVLTLILSLTTIHSVRSHQAERTFSATELKPYDCATFTVDNASTDSIGDVQVTGTSSSADFIVTGYGQYQQLLCFTATAVNVQGTSVPWPVTANIILANNDTVAVTWQSTNEAEIRPTTGE